MTAAFLGLTYIAAALCYAASPSTSSSIVFAPATPGQGERRGVRSPRWMHRGGLALLGLSGLGFAVIYPVGAGLLVWLSAVMMSLSLLVIAAPLASSFVKVSSALALVIAVIGTWL
ncbi:hypothetical protein CRI94_16140 [Longibacter salinarum]|uniref:DUF3325 domain-containing protein n=1 Tax=Longibacter salinarum TaxID=1850348 RepID=A0A2A8CU84_9BACT|nr:hypothetical protein [Longibacter salinarum]PEN11316.1 hypothetical protein CRI94_16140 [Longibacter salinarum]